MPYTTLIDTESLASHLSDPAVVIVDCRFDLADVSWGEREYLVGHIPGAEYAHLDNDLSGDKTGSNGRHPLPSVEALTKTFSRFGIEAGVQVVGYDQDNGMYASRLWWLLRWLGHDASAVLDGGFRKWTAEGRTVDSGWEPRRPGHFNAMPRHTWTIDAAKIAALSGNPDWRLVDARAPERFRGESETIDKAAGHIPGAINHFYKWNLDDRGTFLSPDTLRAQFERALDGLSPDRVVSYCGSGVTACHNLLALEHAGLKGAALYPGSWSEWASDPTRPIAKGGR